MPTKLLTLVFLCFGALTAQAWDICEDINDLANDWNEVANFVDECHEDDEFTDSEIRILVKYITDLAEDTYLLADALIDLGNQRETRLGTQMRKAMARIAEEEDQDRMVRELDKLVDIIDRTTDYCDE
ncbi:MAG: hypothetical protein QNK37_22160 [Acidobacteriota bacterium]|nr:hypothetical protein [Acidobacteriota bacterium]